MTTKQYKLDIIKNMYTEGHLIKDIVEYTGVSKDTIKLYLYRTFGKDNVSSEIKRRWKLNLRNSRLGDKSHLWSGGKEVTASGYVRLNLGGGKRQLEHRFIMEQHIGRKLLKTEHVHHKNHVRDDNNIDNLELMSVGDHIRMHNKDFKYERNSNGRFTRVYKQS